MLRSPSVIGVSREGRRLRLRRFFEEELSQTARDDHLVAILERRRLHPRAAGPEEGPAHNARRASLEQDAGLRHRQRNDLRIPIERHLRIAVGRGSGRRLEPGNALQLIRDEL